MRTFFSFFFIFSGLTFHVLAQTDTASKKAITINAAKAIFLNANKDTLTSDEYMRLVNSGLYAISYKQSTNQPTVFILDSTDLLKSIGKKLPELKFTLLNGKKASIKKGHATIINFWSTTCKPCIEELDSLNVLSNKQQNVDFLAITPDSISTVHTFLQGRHFNYKIVFLSNQDIETLLKVSVYPTHFLVDPNYVLEDVYVGKEPATYKKIRNFIKKYK
ncbi:TlpA family protein disulfide reductase [Parafilimonas sp.]|uniref:TlpA family protein disulfide reductase n=1 Tax=Parafilimonas sp. TaxID=1969739 RepID=UPI0039E48A25